MTQLGKNENEGTSFQRPGQQSGRGQHVIFSKFVIFEVGNIRSPMQTLWHFPPTVWQRLKDPSAAALLDLTTPCPLTQVEKQPKAEAASSYAVTHVTIQVSNPGFFPSLIGLSWRQPAPSRCSGMRVRPRWLLSSRPWNSRCRLP